MENLIKQIEELKTALDSALDKINYQQKIDELEKLTEISGHSDFWQNNENGSEHMQKQSRLDVEIKPWNNLKVALDELEELSKLDDDGLEKDIQTQIKKLQEDFEKLKKQLRFSGPYDKHDVILSIHAGAGGTDAQDWANMLMRMYLRWAENSKIKTKIIDESAGDEAGIKSVDIEFSGTFVYGKLKGEHGVHRLVRLSPFNADAKRQTSFAKVEILPKIDTPNQVPIDENDLKIDVFRAGGHGGQSVNTTDSAVRVTHLPSGIVVSIQNERSQLQNKETALTILRSKLAQLQLEQHKENLSEIKGPNQSAEWGNQIRSYVLHPYTMVKDLRTGCETSQTSSVLDGDLDNFIEAFAESNL